MEEKTKEQYNDISLALMKRYSSETGLDWADDPMSFCSWVMMTAPEWSKATWRLRKNALIYFMSHSGPSEAEFFFRNAEKPEEQKDKPLMTSQKKSKKISIADLRSITKALSEETSGLLDLFTAKWLIASLLVGIRPCEWHGAKIEDNALVLQNAKAGKTRSCGETRRIHFKINKLDELSHVFEFVNEMSAMNLTEDDFKKLYEHCRRRLYSVNKLLWPERKSCISFYTARHQFSANAKSTLGLVAVAALMGHKSTDTATRNYLKKRYGDAGMIFVEPDDYNMSLVDDKFGDGPVFNTDKNKSSS